MVDISGRLLAQRTRNNLMDVLETVAFVDEQRVYQAEVDWINVPRELLAQFDEWFPELDEWRQVYTADELQTIEQVLSRRDAVGSALGSSFPDVEAVQLLPEWVAFAEAARKAVAVFQVRGRLPDDHEVS